MWLVKRVVREKFENLPESGRITGAGKTHISASGVGDYHALSVFTPYGFESVPPVGEDILLLPSSSETACIGVRTKKSKGDVGEIRLYSKGGGEILIQNNGDVLINSVRITKDGTVYAKRIVEESDEDV